MTRYGAEVATWFIALLLSCAPEAQSPLADAPSPYLREAARDLVAWRTWGDEAFAEARARDVPVFLSIGYATCHWCHVMARESFRDAAIAAALNTGFVPVKVDREERPDIDAHYLAAIQARTGRAGWPATLVLTPDGAVVWAGGYLPPRDTAEQRGLFETLEEVRAAWRSDPHARVSPPERMSETPATDPPASDLPGAHDLHAAARALLATRDRTHGGFGGAPKFPRPMVVSLLLRYHRRTGAPEARDAALQALRAWVSGALRDPIGGGFHRYTVDAAWDVPHFEKTLPDQALLASALLDGHLVSGDPDLARWAHETLEFMARELRLREGGFISAIDADSDGGEGFFYTWTPDDIRAVAPDRAEALIAALDLADTPEVAGRHAPRTVSPLTDDDRRRLFQARLGRAAPAIDDKVVLGWNGLALSALARGGQILHDDTWLRMAEQTTTFLMRELARDPPSRVWHAGPDGAGRTTGEALLEDYAFLAQGLLDLYEATGNAIHLVAAAGVQQRCDAVLGAPDGTWYRSATEDPRFPRARPRRDGNEPSGASVAVLNLLRLADFLGDDPWRPRAEAALRALTPTARDQGHRAPALMAAVDRWLDSPRQIVIVGDPGDGRREALLDVVRRAWLPNRALVAVPSTAIPSLGQAVPWVSDKQSAHPIAYVCARGVCEAPTSDPEVLRAQLSQVTPLGDAPGTDH